MSKLTDHADKLGLKQATIEVAVLDWLNARKSIELNDTNVSSMIRAAIDDSKKMADYVLPLMAGKIYKEVASFGTKALNNRLSGFRTLIRQVCEAAESPRLLTVVAKKGTQGIYEVEIKEWPQDTTEKALKKEFGKWLKTPTNEHMDSVLELMKLHQHELAEKIETDMADKVASEEKLLNDVRLNQGVLQSIANSDQIIKKMKEFNNPDLPVVKKVANG